jgi:hypothetical protein
VSALLEWPQLSHNAISKRLGVSDVTIGATCRDLVANSQIENCGHRFTEDGRQAQRERIRDALAEYPDDSHNAIAKRLGLSAHTVKEVCTAQTSQCRHGVTGQSARTDIRLYNRRGPQPARRAVTPQIQEQITARRSRGLAAALPLAVLRAPVADPPPPREPQPHPRQERLGRRRVADGERQQMHRHPPIVEPPPPRTWREPRKQQTAGLSVAV